MKKINIIIPIFNEEENIEGIYNAIKKILTDQNVEIIFVDDGSNDNSLKIINNLSIKNKDIKYIAFSRNFGHQIALTAGIDAADGDIIIMMDADFQHPVELLPKMLDKYKEGFDVIQMVKINQGKRKTTWLCPFRDERAEGRPFSKS